MNVEYALYCSLDIVIKQTRIGSNECLNFSQTKERILCNFNFSCGNKWHCVNVWVLCTRRSSPSLLLYVMKMFIVCNVKVLGNVFSSDGNVVKSSFKTFNSWTPQTITITSFYLCIKTFSACCQSKWTVNEKNNFCPMYSFLAKGRWRAVTNTSCRTMWCCMYM